MPVTINGGTGVTIGTGAAYTFGDASTQTSAADPADFGFKNRIINGAMVIDQRNAGASVTPTTSNNVYPVDRFLTYASQSSKYTAQQNAGSVTPPTGFGNYLGFTSSSAYSVTSSDFFLFSQKIEGFNTADLGWGSASAATVTMSFWVRSSLTGTFGGAIRNSANTRFYPFSYTISAANTWEQKSVTIAGDTTGTWVGATNGVGLEIIWSLGAGSSVSGTAGAWSGTAYYSATGATSVVGTNGATFYITGVQLEKNTGATGFDVRPYGTELALCQRYYETGQIIRYGGSTNVSQGAEMSQTFLVSKRAAPTISFTSTSFLSSVTAIGSSNITVNGFVAGFNTNATGFGSGQGTMTANIEL
jgi:hypothetical protein